MVRKRMVSTVMSLMMAAAVLTTVPVTNNVKAADKEITSGDYTYVKESNGKTSYAVLTSYRGSETNLVIPEELDGLQVKAISQGFEKNLKIKSIILSKNIEPAKETHRDLEVLNEIETLEEIRVAKDNLSYQAQDGVLYSKDKKQLFSYPKSKKSETYNMPASVKKVEELASLIGGEIGGSRPAIIEGWLGQDSLVGISGKVITPDICIMLGVSGAAAFFAGVRKSKTIIAVNSDPEAIVFQKCDYVVIEDCMKVVDSLCSCLNSEVD